MILLTGASGVIGSELTTHFSPDEILLGVYRAKPCGKYRHVKIDIQHPRLGLTDQAYQHLLGTVTAIIHCAAITDTNVDDEILHRTNIKGTENIVNFTRDAGAALHFISTAFCSKKYGGSVEDSSYLSSKREAEQLVAGSGVDFTIIRPSIVIGHSLSGRTRHYQGFHLFLTSIVQGRLPFMPLDVEGVCDFLPVDFMACAIENIIRTPQFKLLNLRKFIG